MNPSVNQKGFAHFIAIFLIAIVAVGAFALTNNSLPFKDQFAKIKTLFAKGQGNTKDTLVLKLKNSTDELKKLGNAYKSSDNSKKQSLSPQIVKLAKERESVLYQLIDVDPAMALKYSAADIRLDLPKDAQGSIEEQTSVQGTLRILHGEKLDYSNKSKLGFKDPVNNFVLTQNDKSIVYLYSAGPTSTQLPLGQVVTTTGLKLGDKMAVAAIDKYQLKRVAQKTALTADPSAPQVAGADTYKKVLVYVLNFQDNQIQPYTPDEVRARIFTDQRSTAAYLTEASFYKFSISGKYRTDGDVTNWLTIPYTNESTACDLGNWANSADQVAQAAGVDTTGYDHYMYVFPYAQGCGPGAAFGEQPGNRSWYFGASDFNIVNFADGPIRGTASHELGHNFGLWHAAAYICRDNSNNPTTLGPNCSLDQYSDPFDVMAIPSAIQQHYSAYHKEQLGLYTQNIIIPVTSSNTVVIAPIEGDPTGFNAGIKIPANKDTQGNVTDYYYVDFRQPGLLFDQFSQSQTTATSGVQVRLAPAVGIFNYPALLDMTPGSSGNFDDATLVQGQTFTDSARGISINVSSWSASAATVNVTITGNPCVQSAPTVTLNPTSQNALLTQTLNYTATVTNNDSSNCPNTNYGINVSSPGAGWVVTSNPNTLNLAPGANATTTISVTSPTGETAGAHTFDVSATSLVNSNYIGVVTGTYNVTMSSTPTPTPRPSKNTSLSVVSTTDNFNRTNATTLGTATTGEVWQLAGSGSASLGIQNNQAYNITCAAPGYAVVDALTADARSKVTMVTNGGDTRLPFRFVDTNNFYYFENKGTYYDVIRVSNGSALSLGSIFSPAPANGDVIEVEVVGNNLNVFINNVNQFSSQLSAGPLGTKFGIGSWCNTTMRFDDFSINTAPDTTAPTVSITSPANNSFVPKNTNMTITANASDDRIVTKVEFYAGTTLACPADTVAPYSCVWKTPTKAGTATNLTAKAYDKANNVTTSSIVKVTTQ